jgi:3-oxoacyl-(acyl-carrier-protein) synthase
LHSRGVKQAGLTPDDVGYIEAHGTGTPLGDPIEMQALGEIFRTPNGADARPCYVSSVKANVGHMETVSGVAGLIKVLLMMQHERIAPQTHFESLNPHINLAARAGDPGAGQWRAATRRGRRGSAHLGLVGRIRTWWCRRPATPRTIGVGSLFRLETPI